VENQKMMDGPELEVRNHMEDVVGHMLEDMLLKSEVCKCEICRRDIIAYALNKLPPKYAVTKKGELFFRVSEFTPQFEIDVQVALSEAIKVISEHPRHK